MRRCSLLCAAAGLAVAALAATSPAKADPFHLIRWEGSGFCQIWDDSIPTTPWPGNFSVVSMPLPTFGDALVYKDGLLRSGTCAF